MSRFLLGFALLSLAACSGTTVITNGASPSDDGGTTAPQEDGGSSGTSPDSASADSGGGGGGGGGGGSDKLYPIAVGNTWTYDVAAVGAGSVCTPGSHSQSVTGGPTTVSGKQAYDITSFCTGISGTQPVSPDPSTDAVYFYYNGAWAAFVDAPVTEGHTWTYVNASFTWQRESSVTVPAGTFTDCWTAKQNVSYTAFITYCRGVGMVRSYSADLTGAGWDAKLSSKSF